MTSASHFLYLIHSLIILGLASILRRMPDDYDTIFFRYPSLVPASYLRTLVGNILGVDLKKNPNREIDTKAAVFQRGRLEYAKDVQESG